MTVIVINEECHGFIGLAANAQHAIDFLCNEHWLEEFTELYRSGKWTTVREEYGENWKEVLKSKSLDELQDALDGGFYLHEEEVY